MGNTPYTNRKINDRSFAEKYGSIAVGLMAVIGSLFTMYSSTVTKMEIITFKQKNMADKINVLAARIEKIKAKVEDNTSDIEDIDDSYSRSTSIIMEDIDELKEKAHIR